jgi:hypothetical protein
MELIILILGASALAGCLGGSLYIYERVQRRPFQENERLLALWARLAAASDQLEFVPSLYKRTHGQNSYLVGTYRGHQLKLDTFYRSETKDYTTRQGRYRHIAAGAPIGFAEGAMNLPLRIGFDRGSYR